MLLCNVYWFLKLIRQNMKQNAWWWIPFWSWFRIHKLKMISYVVFIVKYCKWLCCKFQIPFQPNFCEKACYIEKKGVVSNAMESQSFNICTLLLFNLPPDVAFTEINPALVTILALFMHVYLFSGTFWKCLGDFDQEHSCCLQWIQLSFQVFYRKRKKLELLTKVWNLVKCWWTSSFETVSFAISFENIQCKVGFSVFLGIFWKLDCVFIFELN